jgi:hypothetical protein
LKLTKCIGTFLGAAGLSKKWVYRGRKQWVEKNLELKKNVYIYI